MISSDVRFFLLAILFLSCTFNVHAHPNRFSEDDNPNEEELVNSWSLDDLNEGSEHDARRDEALEKLQQVRLQIIVSYALLFVWDLVKTELLFSKGQKYEWND